MLSYSKRSGKKRILRQRPSTAEFNIRMFGLHIYSKNFAILEAPEHSQVPARYFKSFPVSSSCYPQVLTQRSRVRDHPTLTFTRRDPARTVFLCLS